MLWQHVRICLCMLFLLRHPAGALHGGLLVSCAVYTAQFSTGCRHNLQLSSGFPAGTSARCQGMHVVPGVEAAARHLQMFAGVGIL